MNEHFKKLMEIAEKFGEISSACLYRYGYSTVTGTMENGDKFTLTLDVKEAEEDD